MLQYLIALCIKIYVDFFLLWLLYRFMRPQRIHEDGTSEASVLLFAHDESYAKSSLVETFIEESKNRAAELQQQ